MGEIYMDRYIMLIIEKVVNNTLYDEKVIDKRKHDVIEKRLEQLLFEESKKIDHI